MQAIDNINLFDKIFSLYFPSARNFYIKKKNHYHIGEHRRSMYAVCMFRSKSIESEWGQFCGQSMMYCIILSHASCCHTWPLFLWRIVHWSIIVLLINRRWSANVCDSKLLSRAEEKNLPPSSACAAVDSWKLIARKSLFHVKKHLQRGSRKTCESLVENTHKTSYFTALTRLRGRRTLFLQPFSASCDHFDAVDAKI